MRILFISNYYPPYEVGGFEQNCREIAIRFAAAGHDVEVLTSNRGEEGSMEDVGCQLHRQLRIIPSYDTKVSPAIQFFVTRRTDENHNLKCLQSVVADFKPQVIFIWNIETVSKNLATWAESLAGTTVVYWIAGRPPGEVEEFWRYWSYPVKNRLASSVKRQLARLAYAIMKAEGKPIMPRMRHIAVVSNYLRQKGIRERTLPEHTQVIYNGISIDDFYQPVKGPELGPVRLIQAGRLSSDKGVDLSIKALAKLINEQGSKDLRLTLVGGATEAYEHTLRTLVEQENIADYVDFLGWVPRTHLPTILHEHNILLLPTTFQEPFARSILEAMAGGLAVIASNTGGTPEIVHHGESGYLFQSGDVDGLANHIRRLADDPDLRLKVARTGQRLVIEKHSLELMYRKQESLILQALSADGQISCSEF